MSQNLIWNAFNPENNIARAELPITYLIIITI